MSEALRKQDLTQEAPTRPLRSRPVLELLPEVRPTVDTDTVPPQVGERATFEIPAFYWRAMIACYAVLLAALLAATGGGRAGFAIAISAVYVTMFFGTARTLLRQQPAQRPSPLERPGGVLQTIYGPLGRKEVAVQLLMVPAAIATFGIGILCIRLAVL